MLIEIGGVYQYNLKGSNAIVTVLSIDGESVTVKTRNGQVYQVSVVGLKRRIR